MKIDILTMKSFNLIPENHLERLLLNEWFKLKPTQSACSMTCGELGKDCLTLAFEDYPIKVEKVPIIAEHLTGINNSEPF